MIRLVAGGGRSRLLFLLGFAELFELAMKLLPLFERQFGFDTRSLAHTLLEGVWFQYSTRHIMPLSGGRRVPLLDRVFMPLLGRND